MRKVIVGSLMILTLGLSTVLVAGHMLQSSKGIELRTMQVVGLRDLSHEDLLRFFSGEAEELALECTEGDEFPFFLQLGGDYLMLDSGDSSSRLRIMKSCYIKSAGGNLLFSKDLAYWQEFTDFFKGELGFSIGLYNGEQRIGLQIEVNERE